MTCKKVQLTWDEMLDAVKKQKADIVVASTSITTGRRLRGIVFSERYYHTPAMFVRRKGDSVEGIWKSLRGKTIGVQATTTHDQFVTSEFAAVSEIVRYKTLPEMVQALLDKKVDIILADAWALDRSAINGKNGKKLEFTGPPYNDRRWFGEGIGVILPSDDPSLKNKIDDAIASMSWQEVCCIVLRFVAFVVCNFRKRPLSTSITKACSENADNGSWTGLI